MGVAELPVFMRPGSPLGLLYEHLAARSIEVRLVGGSLRDYLMSGDAGADYDLAVNADPATLTAAFGGSRYRVYPTGISHGTVTAVDPDSGRSFELTGLRIDRVTDGRHAEVEFVNDWRRDAARRDFTINAMSLDFSGRLYDYFGGLEDLKRRRLRFVCDVRGRIREDYLRIFRFFRFIAGYPLSYSNSAMAVIFEMKAGVRRLSKERIGREIRQTMRGARAWRSAALMAEGGILTEAIPGAAMPDRAVTDRDRRLRSRDSSFEIMRLSLLTEDEGAIVSALRFSRAERGLFTMLCSARDFGRLLHRHPVKEEAALWLRRRYVLGKLTYRDYRGAMAKLRRYRPKRFPITGGEVAKAVGRKGLPPEAIGKARLELENRWLDGGRRTDKAGLRRDLDGIIEDIARSYRDR